MLFLPVIKHFDDREDIYLPASCETFSFDLLSLSIGTFIDFHYKFHQLFYMVRFMKVIKYT